MLLLNHGGSVVGTAAGGLVERVRIFFSCRWGTRRGEKLLYISLFIIQT